MDAEKCFDKLWLQACINALFDAGLDNEQLNLLYIENKNATIEYKSMHFLYILCVGQFHHFLFFFNLELILQVICNLMQ